MRVMVTIDLAPKFDPLGKLVFKGLASGFKRSGAKLGAIGESGERSGVGFPRLLRGQRPEQLRSQEGETTFNWQIHSTVVRVLKTGSGIFGTALIRAFVGKLNLLPLSDFRPRPISM